MSKSVTLIRSTSLSSVAEYAYAATAPAEARLIFLAGSCPLNEDGSTAAIGDYAGQAAKAVDNLRTALSDAGASITDVINTRVLVASSNQADLVAAWEVVRDAFGDHDAPSTLMGVTVLGYDDQLVEIWRQSRPSSTELEPNRAFLPGIFVSKGLVALCPRTIHSGSHNSEDGSLQGCGDQDFLTRPAQIFWLGRILVVTDALPHLLGDGAGQNAAEDARRQ